MSNRRRLRCDQGDAKKIRPVFQGGLELRPLTRKGTFEHVSALHVTMPSRYRHSALYHAKTHEWFYILEGRTTISIDGKPRRLKPGTFIYIAPGVPHTVSSGDHAVKVLVLFSPPMDLRHPDICLVGKKSRAKGRG